MINIPTLIKNMFKIAKLLSVNDSGALRFYTISTLGKTQKVLGFSPYGLMHHPPSSSLVTMWSQQAQESNGIGMADDPTNRTLKSLKEGEVGVGNYITGDYVVFKDGNIVDLVFGSTLNITGPTININCTDYNLTASNDITMTATKNASLSGTDVNMTATGGSGGVDITSATLEHNGTNVGDDHVHDGSPTAPTGPVSDTGGPK